MIMLKPLLTLVFSLVAATTLSAADWQEVKLADGKFRVEFPGKPKTFDRDAPTDTGTIKAHFHKLELDDGKLVYMVVHSPLSNELIAMKKRDRVLDDAIAASKPGYGKVLKAEPSAAIALGKHGGRTLDLHVEKSGTDAYVAARIYLVGDVLLQIVIIKTGESISAAEKEPFFTSLKLLNDVPVAAAPPAARPAAAEWREVKLADGAFRVELPGEPESSSQKVRTEAGTLTAHIHMVEIDDRLIYLVSHTEYPIVLFELKSRDQLLANGIEACRASFERVIGTGPLEKISVGKHPGRSFDVKGVKGGNEIYYSVRMFLVDNRLIQLGIIKTEDWASIAERERFFNSLKISND